METHYNKKGINAEAIARAEQVLKDNGIEEDEVQTVLQAIGYTLLDCELYPAPIHPENKTPSVIEYTKVLTEGELDEVYAYAQSHLWGLSKKTLKEKIKEYKSGDLKEKCKIYALLEDCNFHTLSSLLVEEKYAEARKWVDANT